MKPAQKKKKQKWGREGAQNLPFKTNIPDMSKASFIYDLLCSFG